MSEFYAAVPFPSLCLALGREGASISTGGGHVVAIVREGRTEGAAISHRVISFAAVD